MVGHRQFIAEDPVLSKDPNMLWSLHQIQSFRIAKLEEQLAIRQEAPFSADKLSTLAGITDQPVAPSKSAAIVVVAGDDHLVDGEEIELYLQDIKSQLSVYLRTYGPPQLEDD